MPDDPSISATQQSKSGFALRVHHEQVAAEKELDQKKINAAVTSTLATAKVARSVVMGGVIALDQLSRFTTALTPVKDALISSTGYASAAFSALATIISIAHLVDAAIKGKQNKDKNAVKNYLFGEQGLKQLIPAVLGCAAAGVMIAMASIPIAVIVAAAISFAIQQISDIIFQSAKISQAQKELKALESENKTETNLEKKSVLSDKIKSVKRHINTHAKKLGISAGALVAGTVAFTLIAAGIPTMNVALIAAGAIILTALAIFSLVMMSIGIHKKRMAHQKEKAKLLEGKPKTSEAEEKHMSPQEKEKVHDGILGMAIAARKHETQKVHNTEKHQSTHDKKEIDEAHADKKNEVPSCAGKEVPYCTANQYTKMVRSKSFDSYFPRTNTKTTHPDLTRSHGTKEMPSSNLSLKRGATPKRARPGALTAGQKTANRNLLLNSKAAGYNQRVRHLNKRSIPENNSTKNHGEKNGLDI